MGFPVHLGLSEVNGSVFLIYDQNRAKPVAHPRHDERMDTRTVQQDIAEALALIERANARLRPDELSRPEARSLIDPTAAS
jgi:hypothetical protein